MQIKRFHFISSRQTSQLQRQNQNGMSLVEVMIALTIGTILTIGVVQLFVANRETYQLLQGQSRLQESARFGLEFISRSVRMAGYKGCFSVNGRVNSTIDPPANIPYEFDIRESILGHEWVSAGIWHPPLNELPHTVTTPASDTSFEPGNGIPADEVAEGTDILVIRHISHNELKLATDMLTSSDNVVITKPAAGLDFGCDGCAVANVIPARTKDDLVLIYDCEKSTIFRITQINNELPAAGQATLLHDTSDTDATRNVVAQLAEFNTFEGLDAGVAAIVTNIFYIAPGTGLNNQDVNPLSLWKKTGTNAPVELVEGVENLQVEYGIDTTNDDVPNQYVSASGVTDPTDVVTIRVEITTNTVDDVGSGSVDGMIRRSVSQTMQIRNKG